MTEKEIVFFIDKQQFKTTEKKISASDLLVLADEDPNETTLVLKKGNDLEKLDDNYMVCLKNGMHFVVYYDGPTTVSYFGPDRLINELSELGYKPSILTALDNNKYVVIKNFLITLGVFKGRSIDLGFLATTDFPVSMSSAIHIKSNPILYDKADSIPNVRNIIDSPLGSEWRYWSINFNWVSGGSARRFISKVNTVFNNA